MFKFKYNIKIILHDNYSKRKLKQQASSHEIVSIAKFRRHLVWVLVISYRSPFEIIFHSDSSNMYVFALQ